MELILEPNVHDVEIDIPDRFKCSALTNLSIVDGGMIYILNAAFDAEGNLDLFHEGMPVACVCIEDEYLTMTRVSNEHVQCTISMTLVLVPKTEDELAEEDDPDGT